MNRLVAIAALFALAGCEQGPSDEQILADADAAIASTEATLEQLSREIDIGEGVLSEADQGRACRAVIASLNGRDPAIIQVIEQSANYVTVRYTRDDGAVWTNQCRVGKTTAEWRMVENGTAGRWRTEDTVRFQIEGPSIKVQTFMSGEKVTDDVFTVE